MQQELVLKVPEEVGLEDGVLGVVGLDHGGEEACNLLGAGREGDRHACETKGRAEGRISAPDLNFTTLCLLPAEVPVIVARSLEEEKRDSPLYFILTCLGSGSYGGGKSTPA